MSDEKLEILEQGDLSDEKSVLRIRNLVVKYKTFQRDVIALTNVSLDVPRSTIIAIVGESGCGKSTLGYSIIGLLPRPPAEIGGGEILFQNKDILKLDEPQIVELRGTGISMIFQEPMTSLDPVYSVGQQLNEAIDVREKRKKRRAGFHAPVDTSSLNPSYAPPGLGQRMAGSGVSSIGRRNKKYSEEAIDALKRVHISDPERVIDKYPHELSGGMAQRVMIAMALIEKPAIVIADEPTSALDVTTQAQVLFLMRELREEIGTSILFITHDLAVAAQIADQVVVMYAGEIVEQASVEDMFHSSLHPYTEGLLKSFSHGYKDEGKIEAISGDVPNLKYLPSGCRFHPRCKYAFARCSVEHPSLDEVLPGHKVACFLRSPSSSNQSN
jgi:oligopeptide/dipeptide ABC transporter ATP-binding protein